MTSEDLPTLDTYRRATETMRDTTKWLTALLPLAAAVAVVGSVAQRYADATTSSRYWMGVFALSGLVLAGVIVRRALAVFDVAVAGWGDAVKAAAPGAGVPKSDSPATKLDADGVLRLYGFTAVKDLFSKVAKQEALTANDVTAAGLVVDYLAYTNVRAAFRNFLGWTAILVIGILAAVAATQLAYEQEEALARVDGPVQVELNPTSAADTILEAAGCEPDLKAVSAWVIDGTLGSPTVVLDDDSCQPTVIDWDPSLGVVVPKSD